MTPSHIKRGEIQDPCDVEATWLSATVLSQH
jgi:hypothetical protein